MGAQAFGSSEFPARRRILMEKLADGITLLHAESEGKRESQPSFVQNASFFYYTGLLNVPSAILALDGGRKEARLFVPPSPKAFGFTVDSVIPPASAAAELGLTQIAPWDSLLPYLKRRMSEGVSRLYVDEARRSEPTGVPEGFWPVAGSRTLWQRSLTAALPGATIASAAEAIRSQRFIKSKAELAVMRETARSTAFAVRAAMRALEPGIKQRQVEMRAAQACVDGGASGPSFWPWTMTGPNAHFSRLVRSDFSYDQLNRQLAEDELVRIDVGCTSNGYGGDVGRTAPVSGVYTEGQAEVWDLLITAYRAGMAKMRPGVTIADVMAASRAAIEKVADSLQTPEGKDAARVLLAKDGMSAWSIHSVGVESGETALDTLEMGAVIAFEPMFSVGKDAYYLEDMILITSVGAEVLSTDLPYTAEEIEGVMMANTRVAGPGGGGRKGKKGKRRRVP
jgi:Xaa-Pro aminopeptidase